MADCVAKGRIARADRNGVHLHPHRRPFGERNGAARLTMDDVQTIRAAMPFKYGDQIRLARHFGVSRETIRNVTCRTYWRNNAPDFARRLQGEGK
jgi:hypothetical protein